jgi:tRNA(fMet)-specific endonuclease VapC
VILDTNALSAIADGDSAPLDELGRFTDAALPVIVLGEYRFGIAQSRRRQHYERWLNDTVSRCRVLLIDEITADWYALLRNETKRSGTPLPSNDLWIAALCRQHRLPILSRDRHFDRIKGLKRVGW